jgi:hypothetical protein
MLVALSCHPSPPPDTSGEEDEDADSPGRRERFNRVKERRFGRYRGSLISRGVLAEASRDCPLARECLDAQVDGVGLAEHTRRSGGCPYPYLLRLRMRPCPVRSRTRSHSQSAMESRKNPTRTRNPTVVRRREERRPARPRGFSMRCLWCPRGGRDRVAGVVAPGIIAAVIPTTLVRSRLPTPVTHS